MSPRGIRHLVSNVGFMIRLLSSLHIVLISSKYGLRNSISWLCRSPFLNLF